MSTVLNWTLIENTCPEFRMNSWDFILAIVAFAGVVMTGIQIYQFHQKKRKGSVFLGQLAGCDFTICFYYLWMYFVTSLTMHYQNNVRTRHAGHGITDVLKLAYSDDGKFQTFAEWRIEMQTTDKLVRIFNDTFMTLIFFCIVVEKFLWTFSSRTRLTWTMFTMAKPKLYIILASAIYSVVQVFTKSFVLSDIPFCDIALQPDWFVGFIARFFQLYLVPGISIILHVATFIFACLTIPRLSKIGQEENVVSQEEGNSEDVEAKVSAKVNTDLIKRSIICMLVVYATFLIRTFCYYIFIDPQTSNLFKKVSNSRTLTHWWYDFMSVIFSGSRYIVYYAFCRDQLVTEFPPMPFGQ
ncbi:Protein CBG10358 [Caenorhabditis briggsae]|uniref:Protein CBG10358 n=1 Tax=Caenorhabditis briggsae TaxID=6238 RepID=A8XB12_CAEBR|nr:Protein CBG10358 [Caenorhabditis briggsae]CAP29792.2 Protein CBG10358 [Caenorhabditis briggsae]